MNAPSPASVDDERGLGDSSVPAPPPPRNDATATPVGFYSLNVLLSTILFVCIFVTGSAWTAAAVEQVKGDKFAWKMMVFSGAMTLLTFGLSVAFGELARVNRRINVNVQGLLTPSA